MAFSAELELPRLAYGGDTALELTPILEKRIGALQLGINANFERDLGGGEAGGRAEGWEFEPSALVGYRVSPVLFASVEYHGSLGELGSPLPGPAQVHQIFPGVDLRLGDEMILGVSVGAGTTAAGNRLVLASRLEFDF